jgi:glyoxylase-like metal-dependent hydrolase (beta-lactamase superfamily II)
MPMKIQMFTVGELFTNCYIVSCEQTKEAIIIDPGFNSRSEAEKIFKFINDGAFKLKYIVNTHGHPDHTCGNRMVKENFHTPILIHENDASMLGGTNKRIAELFGFIDSSPPPDTVLRDGDALKFGELTLKVLHTPGHSRGSITLIGKKYVFTGDTLFAGSIGRTDFPESSESDMKTSLKKLAALPKYFLVYPGHGPPTTIGAERQSNPFFRWL